MAALSYAICMAIFNSLWQAALLLCGYLAVTKALGNKVSPLAKRNFLFGLLGMQLVLSVITTLSYLLEPSGNTSPGSIVHMAENLVPGISFQTVAPWLVSIYGLTILIKIAGSWYNWKLFRQQYKTGLVKASIELKLFTDSKAHQFGIKRKVKLWLSNNISTPLTFGFLRPVIILPVSLVNRISPEQAETLILHELTHIRSNDFLLNWYLVAIETLFFFNPFVTRLCKNVRFEREKYCDVSVMAFRYSPLLYAQTLLQAAQMKPMATGFQLAAIQHKKQLLQRIEFFTGELNFRRTKKINLALPLLALFLLFVFSLNFIRPVKPAAGNNNFAMAANPTTVPDFEADPIETESLRFAAQIVNGLDDQKLQSIVDETEKVQPTIEQHLKSIEPLIKSIEANAQAISDKALASLDIHPVSFQETGNTRQIIVREEQSGSKAAVIKVYRLINLNGEWVMQPEWMLSAQERALDSTSRIIDTIGTKLQLLNEQ